MDTALVIFKKAKEIIADNPKSISLFKNVDEEYLKHFIEGIVKGQITSYYIVSFTDYKGDIVGACLLSKGSPWYNNKITVVSEEVTVAFQEGVGIARAVAKYLESILGDEADVVMASSANKPVAKLIENTYAKLGYKTFKNYYKEII